MGTKDKIANVIDNPLLCIESPSIYIIPMVCIFSEKKEVSRMLVFVVSLGNDEVKIIEGHTLASLAPAQYDNFSNVEETNQEKETANISGVSSGSKAEIFPVIPSNSKMIFSGDHKLVRKVLHQDKKILVDTQEKLNGLIHVFENITSASSNDIGYTKLIEMDLEYDPDLPPIAFKHYKLPLKCQEWVRKELEDLEKAGIIQRSLVPMLHLLE